MVISYALPYNVKDGERVDINRGRDGLCVRLTCRFVLERMGVAPPHASEGLKRPQHVSALRNAA